MTTAMIVLFWIVVGYDFADELCPFGTWRERLLTVFVWPVVVLLFLAMVAWWAARSAARWLLKIIGAQP